MRDIEKKPQALKEIVQSLRDIDNYNLCHTDAKMMDMKLFIPEIMEKFSVSEWVAKNWLIEAIDYNKVNHEAMLKEEAIVRKVKSDNPNKEVGSE